jgi:phosphatidylserine/phosphatidylglycerophosphate/cardiolipin synthase-like enzyme
MSWPVIFPVKIVTPYFLPDEQVLTALQLAKLRGVDVRLVLPAVNNHRLVTWAARAHIRPLLHGLRSLAQPCALRPQVDDD